MTVIVGVQWGDEGKGRVVDLYAADADIVARFGGGDNAGHTLVVGKQKIALRLVPSGVLVPGCELFIGSGTVINLTTLQNEIDALSALGVDAGRIKLSDRAHVVFPRHVEADKASGGAIGTTGRGIGPAYVDKAARSGTTVGDLLRRGELPPSLRAHVVDGAGYIHRALEQGKRILAEGAQGTMLDVSFGTYPFVTSSHTLAGGATVGLGIGPREIRRVVGIAKAYCTRVGAGPFPSELTDATGERLRTAGGEFGTVTGRPRRCGWFDAVAARYAARLNGLDALVLTKLDVLTGLERIGIVSGYSVAGQAAGVEAMGDPGLSVDIDWYEGWDVDLSAIRHIGDLPSAARTYVAAIERMLSVAVEGVSVGAERSMYAAAGSTQN
ncbi:MAG: adenylosuccinate synthetase [Candidatus Eremiobacteraeota bacterium]|nr:adenylosuccinate synthetase [Candidatus Eremiobacteraeota bacterium]MBV8356133.1 adenylosuccinate synthetase [Candidatus Eremiobacteraeota bacterium]